MATQSPAAGPPKTGKQPRELPNQPEEQFWQRYSANHEFPLSTVTSVATHFLIGGLVIIIAFYWSQVRDERDKPLAMDTISAGGGGDPLGAEDSSGTGPSGESADVPPVDTSKNQAKVDIPPLPEEKRQPDDIPIQTSVNFDDYIKTNKAAKEKIDKMAPLDKQLLQGLAKGTGPRPKGEGGSGTGGGRGSGVGPGKGSGVGPGNENIRNKRIERKMRWTMNFNTFDGRDYAKQLEDMGAIIAAPLPGETRKYTLIRNIGKPSKKEVTEDLNALDRIWWTDDNPRSVHELAVALEIRQIPPVLIAFFPHELEERLANLELDYAKKHNKSLDHVAETIFQVRRKGSKYEPEIMEERFK
ncbi:MAG: hypothetical protein ACJ8FY_19050 [Gemmataceae bacterium]